jgi:hypothetical protein
VFLYAGEQDPQIIDAIEGKAFKTLRSWTGIDIFAIKQHLTALSKSDDLERSVEHLVSEVIAQPVVQDLTEQAGIVIAPHVIAAEVGQLAAAHASEAEKGIAAAEAKVKEGIKDGIAAAQKHVITLLAVACTLFMLGVFVGATVGFMNSLWLALVGIVVAVIFGQSKYMKWIWFQLLDHCPDSLKKEQADFVRSLPKLGGGAPVPTSVPV